jgi:hypothetical protein
MQNNETFHTTRVLAFFCFKWQRQRTTICWCRKTSKGIAATRRGRRLRHFNSRSFFRQNSAQTFAKWIKPAVKLLFCLRRQHRRRTPSSFWSVKKHPESMRMVIWDRENFCWGQPGSRELSSETEKLFQIALFENIAHRYTSLWSSMSIWIFCIWSSETEKLTVRPTWKKRSCHLRQKNCSD